MIYNDHVSSFFCDHYSAFALGVDNAYAGADEGRGARLLPRVPGDAALSRHIATCMMADVFDLSFFQHRPLDHGCRPPLSMLEPGSNQLIKGQYVG